LKAGQKGGKNQDRVRGVAPGGTERVTAAQGRKGFHNHENANDCGGGHETKSMKRLRRRGGDISGNLHNKKEKVKIQYKNSDIKREKADIQGKGRQRPGAIVKGGTKKLIDGIKKNKGITEKVVLRVGGIERGKSQRKNASKESLETTGRVQTSGCGGDI